MALRQKTETLRQPSKICKSICLENQQTFTSTHYVRLHARLCSTKVSKMHTYDVCSKIDKETCVVVISVSLLKTLSQMPQSLQ